MDNYNKAVGSIAKAFSLTGEEAMEFIKKASELGQYSNISAATGTKALLDKGEIVIPLSKVNELRELTKEYEDRAKHKNDALDPIANAMAAIKHIQSEYGSDKKEKLLVIELDDIDAVPKVTYKGQSMNPLQELELYWETATDLVSNNPAQLRIKSADKNCNSRTIGHNI